MTDPRFHAANGFDWLWDWTYDRQDSASNRVRLWAIASRLPYDCPDDCPGRDEEPTPIWRVLLERARHATDWITNDPCLTSCDLLDADLRYRFWSRLHTLAHNWSITLRLNNAENYAPAET